MPSRHKRKSAPKHQTRKQKPVKGHPRPTTFKPKKRKKAMSADDKRKQQKEDRDQREKDRIRKDQQSGHPEDNDPEGLMSTPEVSSPPNPPSAPGGDITGGDVAKRAQEQDRPGNYPAGAPDAGTGTPEDDEARAKRGTQEPMQNQRATNPGPTERR